MTDNAIDPWGRKAPWRKGEGPHPFDPWIPWTFVGLFGVFLVANVIMIWIALTSWTGLTTAASYDKGLAYNRELAALEAQREQGWEVSIGFDPAGLVASGPGVGVKLVDREGAAITDATVVVTLMRRTSTAYDQTLTLGHIGDGRYHADADLDGGGRWQARAVITREGSARHVATRTFVVPR